MKGKGKGKGRGREGERKGKGSNGQRRVDSDPEVTPVWNAFGLNSGACRGLVGDVSGWWTMMTNGSRPRPGGSRVRWEPMAAYRWSLLVTAGHCWALLLSAGFCWSLLAAAGNVAGESTVV